ncbi:unnamed protein product [Phytophthora lilii]|uniref:Unnamed protein product n=1 Tax=Phytophthora lilii TaxID=2077276 RepID=A0A9W6XD38_9STRA|nr:unnamed protein product [Phytophthora lilii]
MGCCQPISLADRSKGIISQLDLQPTPFRSISTTTGPEQGSYGNAANTVTGKRKRGNPVLCWAPLSDKPIGESEAGSSDEISESNDCDIS